MHPNEKQTATSETTQEEGHTEPLTAAMCTIPIAPIQAKQILLATAVVMVHDSNGEAHKCRVLLDSGSMTNFMTSRMAEFLRLPKEIADVPIDGVNEMKTEVKYKVNAKVVSRTTSFESTMDYLVVPRVAGALPAMKIDPQSWHIPESMQLADPNFHEPDRIDMLVGAELFFDVLQEGKIKLSSNLPLLQESELGWLVSGPMTDTAVVGTEKVCETATSETANEQLIENFKRFSTIDLLEGEASLSPDDITENGPYVMKLPFYDTVGELGGLRGHARRRFLELERHLKGQPELKHQVQLKNIVLTADTPEMNRLEVVDEIHRKQKQILWRENDDYLTQEIKMCFNDGEVAEADVSNDGGQFPKLLTTLLENGGLWLHNCYANDQAILEVIPFDTEEKQMNVKPANDCCDVSLKRMVLSEMVKWFDPHDPQAAAVDQHRIRDRFISVLGCLNNLQNDRDELWLTTSWPKMRTDAAPI